MTSKLRARPPEQTAKGHVKGLIFGATGVGKTWFATAFPAPYYIDTEGGANKGRYQARLKAAGGAYAGQADGALDFDFILEEMRTLATEPHPYKTLVIDSVTKVYQTNIARESERLDDKDVFGASKKKPIACMRRLVSWLERLDMNVWFIAHEAAEWGEVKGQRTEIGKIPDVWEKLAYELDLTLHFQRHGRSAKALRTASVWKTRLEAFPDGDRIVLEDNGSELGYAEFAVRYGKEAIEAVPKTVKLANDAQVSEILQLLTVLNVPAGDIEKTLTKAGAENWNELTQDQAVATIAWLRKKVQ